MSNEGLKIKAMLKKSWVGLLLCFCCSTAYGNFSITVPPKGWEKIDDPSQLPQKVKIIYIGMATVKSPFTPSLNVATEETTLNLKEYIALAKTYHEAQAGTRCTPLGPYKTDAGSVELLQIDRSSQWGDIRFVQGMIITEGQAYVITATCLKKEFAAHSAPIFKAIQSFTLQK